MKLLSASEFAHATSVPERTVRRAYSNAAQGKPWKGEPLPVVPLEGQRGGAGGVTYALDPSRLSPSLLAKYPGLRVLHSDTAARLPAPIARPVAIADWRITEQRRRHEIIRPALGTAKGSKARGEACREIEAKHGVDEKTAQRWLLVYEAKGLAGLLPKANGNPGVPRVLISRAWDKSIDLDAETKVSVADSIARTARSMARNNGTSDREIIRLSAKALQDQCVSSGSALPAAKLAKLCKLNPKWCSRIDTAKYRMGYLHKHDHGAWQDKSVARISRDLHAQPMGLLIGDVHYVDMLVTGDDGRETIRVRLIAPDGPKALDRAMERAARREVQKAASGCRARKAKRSRKAQGQPPPGPDELAAFYAVKVNSDEYLPPSMISNAMCEAMLARGLVTPERLRMRGVR